MENDSLASQGQPVLPEGIGDALRPGLVDRLRSLDHTPPVDPKAVYRTRPVALFEEAAGRITRLQAELATCASMMLILAEGMMHTHPGTAERLMVKAHEAADVVTDGALSRTHQVDS